VIVPPAFALIELLALVNAAVAVSPTVLALANAAVILLFCVKLTPVLTFAESNAALACAKAA